MSSRGIFLWVVVIAALVGGSSALVEPVSASTARGDDQCRTRVNAAGEVPPDVQRALGTREVIGGGSLWIPGSPHLSAAKWAEYRLPDGQWYLKFPWFRTSPGSLVVEAERRGGGGNFEAEFMESAYPQTGFLPSGLHFSHTGCWRITATYGDSTVTFLMKIPAKADSS